MRGLEYVAVLLQNPGQPIAATQLQALAGGGPTIIRQEGDGRTDLSLRSRFDDEQVDSQTRREVNDRIGQIELEISFAKRRPPKAIPGIWLHCYPHPRGSQEPIVLSPGTISERCNDL